MKDTKTISLIALIVLFILTVTIRYVGSEQNIYFWDFNAYWQWWQVVSVQFANAPLNALLQVRNSIMDSDYNTLALAITAIFSLLPLPSRMAYILSLMVIYFLPTVIIFSLLCHRFCENHSALAKTLTLVLPATFVAFWGPTLRGYPDICGLIFVMGAVLYSASLDLGAKFQFKQTLLLGALLWAPFLLRRWYAYTVISLFVSLPMLNYLLHARSNYHWHRIKIIVINFFIAGITTCLLAIFFQGQLLQRIISTDYATIYSAYQTSLGQSINVVLHRIGLYLAPFFILGIIITLSRGEPKQRIFVLFCLFNLLFSFFLFTRTQSPGIHHTLPFALWVLLITSFGILWILDNLPGNISPLVITIVIATGSLYIHYQSLFNTATPSKFVANILPLKMLPLRVDNWPVYVDLGNKIDLLTRNGEKVAIFSSSAVLNDDMLDTLLDEKLQNRITYTSQIDLRDGINLAALQARYLVITDPVQLHNSADGQRVITIPTNALLQRQNIGQAYQRLPHAYHLDNNVTAWIFEKIRPFTPTEFNEFLREFYRYYPQWQTQYDRNKYSIDVGKCAKGRYLGSF
jgi:hypothetical protein